MSCRREREREKNLIQTKVKEHLCFVYNKRDRYYFIIILFRVMIILCVDVLYG